MYSSTFSPDRTPQPNSSLHEVLKQMCQCCHRKSNKLVVLWVRRSIKHWLFSQKYWMEKVTLRARWMSSMIIRSLITKKWIDPYRWIVKSLESSSYPCNMNVIWPILYLWYIWHIQTWTYASFAEIWHAVNWVVFKGSDHKKTFSHLLCF